MVTIIIILIVVFLLWKITPNPTNQRASGMMLQMLESFNIIDSTLKFDIFTQRLDFLGELATTLPSNIDKHKCIEVAIHSYTHKYPDKSISPTIRLILDKPDIATSAKFRDEATTAFYLRTCDRLKSEIRSLKTLTAKQRRVQQAHELANIVIGRLASLEKQNYIEYISNELNVLSNGDLCPLPNSQK